MLAVPKPTGSLATERTLLHQPQRLSMDDSSLGLTAQLQQYSLPGKGREERGLFLLASATDDVRVAAEDAGMGKACWGVSWGLCVERRFLPNLQTDPAIIAFPAGRKTKPGLCVFCTILSGNNMGNYIPRDVDGGKRLGKSL